MMSDYGFSTQVYSLALQWSCAVLLFSSCASPPAVRTFQGEAQAIALAEDMFAAIGGKQAWCELRSLYIKANHTEPQMTIPYRSEIWRALDEFDLVIEQQNDSFHVKAIINDQGGKIRYYDDRDTSRILSPQQLDGWKHGHQHNIYVLLHALGCDPQNYSVQMDKDNRLAFYRDSTLISSFELDNQMRPYLFFSPNPDGNISGSKFTHWSTDGGLIHSAGGHPLDSNFMYLTEIWQPSNKPLKESFEAGVFKID